MIRTAAHHLATPLRWSCRPGPTAARASVWPLRLFTRLNCAPSRSCGHISSHRGFASASASFMGVDPEGRSTEDGFEEELEEDDFEDATADLRHGNSEDGGDKMVQTDADAEEEGAEDDGAGGKKKNRRRRRARPVCPFPPDTFGHQLYGTRNRLVGHAEAIQNGFPQTRDEAYRIQLEVEKSFSDRRRDRPKGWRLSHTSAAHRLVAGVSAPILHPVHHCYISLADKQRIQHPRAGHSVLYPEAVFQLGEDLPLRVVDDLWFPYTAHEVAARISSYGPGAALERYHLGLTPEILGPVREHTLIADSCGCRYTLQSHIRHSPPMLTSLMSQGLVSIQTRKQTRYSAEISQAMGNPLTALTYLVNEIQRLNFQRLMDTGEPEPFYELKADLYLSVALCGPQPVLSPLYTILFDHFFRPADVLEVRLRLDALPHSQTLRQGEQRRQAEQQQQQRESASGGPSCAQQQQQPRQRQQPKQQSRQRQTPPVPASSPKLDRKTASFSPRTGGSSNGGSKQ